MTNKTSDSGLIPDRTFLPKKRQSLFNELLSLPVWGNFAQAGDDRRQFLQRELDLLHRIVAREAEADRAMRGRIGKIHRTKHM